MVTRYRLLLHVPIVKAPPPHADTFTLDAGTWDLLLPAVPGIRGQGVVATGVVVAVVVPLVLDVPQEFLHILGSQLVPIHGYAVTEVDHGCRDAHGDTGDSLTSRSTSGSMYCRKGCTACNTTTHTMGMGTRGEQG